MDRVQFLLAFASSRLTVCRTFFYPYDICLVYNVKHQSPIVGRETSAGNSEPDYNIKSSLQRFYSRLLSRTATFCAERHPRLCHGLIIDGFALTRISTMTSSRPQQTVDLVHTSVSTARSFLRVMFFHPSGFPAQADYGAQRHRARRSRKGPGRSRRQGLRSGRPRRAQFFHPDSVQAQGEGGCIRRDEPARAVCSAGTTARYARLASLRVYAEMAPLQTRSCRIAM